MDWVAFLVSDKTEFLVRSLPHSATGRVPRFFPGTREVVTGVRADTASNYVSHLTGLLRAAWGVDCMLYWPRLSLYLRHLRASPVSRAFKRPVTKTLLVHLLSDESVDLAVRVACLVGFQGLLRVSEFVSASRTSSFSGGRNLLRSDITFCRVRGVSAVRVYLRGSKTDPYNTGREIFLLSSPGSPLCPVRWLSKYFDATSRAASDGPAFVLCSSPALPSSSRARFPPRHGASSRGSRDAWQYVTASDIRAALKSASWSLGQDPSHVSAHSLRIGGAMALVEAGVPMDDIRILGRWRSDAFLQYVRMTWSRLQFAARAVSVPGDDPVLLRAGM